MAASHRILAIGLDAGEPVWLERWIAEGALPNIAEIARKGSYVRLRSVAHLFDDAVWPSFFTGTSPATHGIYYFRQVEPGTMRLVSMANRCHKRPFWLLLRELGKKVIIFDVPKAPLGKEGADCQVIGWGEHYPLVCGSRPAGLFKEIRKRYGWQPHHGEVFPTRSAGHERKLLDRILSTAERRALAMRYLMSRMPWDLAIAVFSESHSAGHQFYHHLDPSHPAHEPERARLFEGALKTVYRAIDSAIGDILENVPADTDIVVFSAHGLETKYTTRLFVRPLLERLGYQVPAPPGRDLLGRLRDCIPQRIRREIDRRLPFSAQNGLASRFFEHGCDWGRTRAVAEEIREGSPWIRINLRGREPWGIVEPGKDYDALCRELTDDLMKLRIGSSGRRAIREVWRTDQVFRGPRLSELPDLVIEWERGAPIAALEHPALGSITSDRLTLQKSQHTARAFLAVRGPRFQSGARAAQGHITDLAPTLLYLMGSPIPSAMEGRVLRELIRDEFLAENPPRVERLGWDWE